MKKVKNLNSNRKTGILFGVFFLTAMVTSMLGSIMDPVLGSNDYLLLRFLKKRSKWY
jgi:hypothetical protein